MCPSKLAKLVTTCVAISAVATAFIFIQYSTMVVTVAFSLLTLLAIGWREALRVGHLGCKKQAGLHWVHVSLLALIIGVAPLLPVIVVAGMQRYAHVPFIPWVPLLKR